MYEKKIQFIAEWVWSLSKRNTCSGLTIRIDIFNGSWWWWWITDGPLNPPPHPPAPPCPLTSAVDSLGFFWGYFEGFFAILWRFTWSHFRMVKVLFFLLLLLLLLLLSSSSVGYKFIKIRRLKIELFCLVRADGNPSSTWMILFYFKTRRQEFRIHGRIFLADGYRSGFRLELDDAEDLRSKMLQRSTITSSPRRSGTLLSE